MPRRPSEQRHISRLINKTWTQRFEDVFLGLDEETSPPIPVTQARLQKDLSDGSVSEEHAEQIPAALLQGILQHLEGLSFLKRIN